MGLIPQKFDKRFKFNCLFLLCIIIPCTIFGQVEICNNGIDDDGDNLVDLNDEDCACQIIEPMSLIPNPSFEEMFSNGEIIK